eukprot:5149435-Alexandrium_andersonii.AAC.1
MSETGSTDIFRTMLWLATSLWKAQDSVSSVMESDASSRAACKDTTKSVDFNPRSPKTRCRTTLS